MNRLEKVPMRKDPVFDRDGTYQRLLEKNVILHREAMKMAKRLVEQHLKRKKTIPQPIRVLDLACGSRPLIPAAFMEQLSGYRFLYTGIDLNRDQIARARSQFQFSQNVESSFLEGDAWSSEEIASYRGSHIVFIGLNIHHAIPEELFVLFRSLFEVIEEGGIFLNHDFFRPASFPYLRRPDVDSISGESMIRIPKEKLQRAGFPTRLRAFFEKRGEEWRGEFFVDYEASLRAIGFAPEEIDLTMKHLRTYDYPISREEMTLLLEEVGFRVSTHSYANPQHLLSRYFATILAQK